MCIFTNRQKSRQSTRCCGQYTGSSIQTACEQHTQTSISAGKKRVFLQLPTYFHLASLQSPMSSDRQVNFSRRQPANISRRSSAFLTEQISASRSPTTFTFHNPFQLSPLSSLPRLLTKKTEPSAQLFPLYISSTFPGLYNPQFSSCSTKPKCLRMPAKSGSLLLSSVITGLSFSSHSRLNSISLLPRPL